MSSIFWVKIQQFDIGIEAIAPNSTEPSKLDQSALGGKGDDTLIGASSTRLGDFDRDTLTGGSGNDTFVLGNASGVFYNLSLSNCC